MIDVSILIAPIISAVVTAVITGVGVYVAMNNRLSVLETKMDSLSASVKKHNEVIERTYKVETEVDNIYHRIGDIKSEIHHYHN